LPAWSLALIGLVSWHRPVTNSAAFSSAHDTTFARVTTAAGICAALVQGRLGRSYQTLQSLPGGNHHLHYTSLNNPIVSCLVIFQFETSSLPTQPANAAIVAIAGQQVPAQQPTTPQAQ
jgi:hypothetical protein